MQGELAKTEKRGITCSYTATVTFSTVQNTVKMSKFDNHKTFMADLRQLRGYEYSGRSPYKEMAVTLWAPMSPFTSGD